MSWVREAREALSRGEAVRVRPQGGLDARSDRERAGGDARSGEYCELAIDDVVFVRWKGNFLLHLVKQVEADRILIGNNLGRVNGWVPAGDILGKLVSGVPDGSREPPDAT